MTSLRGRPTLCLNMIVKNESNIILRLLETVAPWIDSYCICDTGSTDNTEEIIQTFFESRQLPGRIYKEPFRDFGYNRSHALHECERSMRASGLADYLLLLDADMKLWVNTDVFPNKDKLCQALVGHDAIRLLQGSDQFNYVNTRIVQTGIGATYWGVTHEYLELPRKTVISRPTFRKSDMFVLDIGDGGAKADKFERDIRLLRQGLRENPNNVRYTFYLANSLRDAGYTTEAIDMYEKRIALGGWKEEVWYSHYAIGQCYMRNKDNRLAIFAWMQAYQCFPERLENLYEVVHFYRESSQYHLAYAYYSLAKKQYEKHGDYKDKVYLFMQRDVYDYKLEYEMTVMGYYCNPDDLDVANLSLQVLSYPALTASLQRNILSNYKFYSPVLTKLVAPPVSSSSFSSFVEVVHPQIQRHNPDGFFPSTPTFILGNDNVVTLIVRFVNYRINTDGTYHRQEHVESRNLRMELTFDDQSASWVVTNTPTFLDHDRSLDALYVGVEDVRLFACGSGVLQYSSNRGLPVGRIAVEIGTLSNNSGATAAMISLASTCILTTERKTEKNWVWATDTHMVYEWFPLTLGIPSPTTGQLEITHTLATTPAWFQHVRGSSNGVRMSTSSSKDEIWFLCHVVSFEDRRFYYHLVVVLDATTFEFLRSTRLFTFERSSVEYALGFQYYAPSDCFWIGYSVMDRTTQFLALSRPQLEDLFIMSK